MPYLHIQESNDTDKIKMLNDAILEPSNQIYILYYLEGCGPCNATRPEWAKIEAEFGDKPNIYIVDINQKCSSQVTGQEEPHSFPTMRFITNGGKIVENYEDSNIVDKNRTVTSFINWIKSHSMMGGMKRKRQSKKRISKKRISKKRISKKRKPIKRKKSNIK